MYIKKLEAINLRSIEAFKAEFAPVAGWHVLLGENGSGKTSLAKAIAIVFAGANEAKALRKNWLEWIRTGKEKASVQLDIQFDPEIDKITGKGRALSDYLLPAKLIFSKVKTGTGYKVNIKPSPFPGVESNRYLWGDGEGWFCASYGPYRRFSGGNKEYEKLYDSNPRLAPHLSVFDEDVALTECLAWLIQLHIDELEAGKESAALKGLEKFINESGLLPHGTKLEKVTSKEVFFRDGNGCTLPADDLSDGYRSILSLTFELMRQLVRTYGEKKVFKHILNGEMCVRLPGVVVIDEIDTHLHPSWQMSIGEWFTGIFPHLQFIVTTHSPLICHSASKGSVWKLPAPGTEEKGGQIKGEQLSRLIYGTVLEAYGTGVFGREIGRSKESEEKLKRLAKLNLKSVKGKLAPEEKTEYEDLIKIFPTALHQGL